MVGNGKLDKGETGINGVRVQLVELREKSNGDGVDGTRYEYIWKEVKTGDTSQTLSTVIPRRGNVTFSDLTSQGIGTGEYLFQGLIPGEYIVRFVYGSTDETVLSEKAVDFSCQYSGTLNSCIFHIPYDADGSASVVLRRTNRENVYGGERSGERTSRIE